MAFATPDDGGGGAGPGWVPVAEGGPDGLHGDLDFDRFQQYVLEIHFPVPLPDWGWLWASVATAVQSQMPGVRVDVHPDGDRLLISMTRG